MKKSSARFIIENARVVRVNRREKVAFFTLFAAGSKYDEYHDVTAFEGADNIGEGESVTVTGDLSRKKRKDSKIYDASLIARTWKPGDENLTPALPVSGVRSSAPPVDDSDIPF